MDAVGPLTYGSTNSAAIMETRPRSGTDPDTCLEVFKSHWSQVCAVMSGVSNSMHALTTMPRNALESINTVIRYVDQMVLLLVEEKADNCAQGPILHFMIEDGVVDKLMTWSTKQTVNTNRLKLHHLYMFDMIIVQSKQNILAHKPIIRPMLEFLASCETLANKEIEQQLVSVLKQLCIAVSQNSALLEVLFSANLNQGAAKFLVFSLLIPYIHCEGSIGQEAREALLFIMSLSARNETIGQYIAQNSDFCPVLATGLSGLYSSLPRKMNPAVDDWYCIRNEDKTKSKDLVMFLNSFEFCNAVVQVAHKMVSEQLLSFIYNGFLVPVMAPALHQNDIILQSTDEDDDDSLLHDDASSMEEVIAATAYLDLFIRTATEPSLIRIFLKFVVAEKYDDVNILDSLVTRIQSNSRLCMVTMALFKTLVELNCEDVMHQLVFKYLIPCTHVMVSQRRSVRDVDMYGKTAEKLLTLRPNCCKTAAAKQMTENNTFQFGAAQQSPASSPSAGGSPVSVTSQSPRLDSSSSPGSPSSPVTPRLEIPEGFYMEYLDDARSQVNRCARACLSWSAPYDGENPSPDSLIQTNMADSMTSDDTSAADTSGETLPVVDCVIPESVTSSNRTVVDKKPLVQIQEADDIRGDDVTLDNNKADEVEAVESIKIKSQIGLDTNAMDVSNTDSKHSCNTDGKHSCNTDGKHSCNTDSKHSCNTDVTQIEQQSASDSSPEQQQQQQHSSASRPDSLPALTPMRQSDTESHVSEADSAISGVSAKSDTSLANTDARSDSPLLDNFDESDFNAFLVTLKRVQTPVEFSDSMQDCMNELDAIISDFQTTTTTTSAENIRKPIPLRQQQQQQLKAILSPTSEKSLNERYLSDRNTDVTTLNSPDDAATSRYSNNMKKSISMDTVSYMHGSSMTKSVSMDTMVTTPGKALPNTSLLGPIFTPTRYNLGTPDVGPFLSTLLGKLEAMMQNSLYVNLLLTGLVTRLACYPQPLLRSYLLNHTLVFQPTVKSLLQVLGSVKHKVDAYACTVKEFETLLLKARQFMAWRETPVSTTLPGRMRSDSNLSIVPAHLKEKKTGSAIRDFFRRTITPQKPKPPQSRLQLLETGTGFRYINRQASPEDTSPENPIEALKAKNAVYCALVLEEFIKELAALSQEHAVINVETIKAAAASAASCDAS